MSAALHGTGAWRKGPTGGPAAGAHPLQVLSSAELRGLGGGVSGEHLFNTVTGQAFARTLDSQGLPRLTGVQIFSRQPIEPERPELMFLRREVLSHLK